MARGGRSGAVGGGTAGMFPTSDRTVEQKLARVRGWIADYQAYSNNPDADLARKARTKVKQYQSVAAVLEIAQRTGRDWNEFHGLEEREAA